MKVLLCLAIFIADVLISVIGLHRGIGGSIGISSLGLGLTQQSLLINSGLDAGYGLAYGGAGLVGGDLGLGNDVGGSLGWGLGDVDSRHPNGF